MRRVASSCSLSFVLLPPSPCLPSLLPTSPSPPPPVPPFSFLLHQLYALSSSHDSTLIATSCKSTNALHAVVRLYSTKTWKPLLNPLAGHSLTVTRIAFSRDDRFIVTVGRDRGWGIYERDEEGEGESRTFLSERVLNVEWRPVTSSRLSNHLFFCSPLKPVSGYHPLAFNPKPHARIIWDVSFSPLFPSTSPSSSSPTTPSSSFNMLFATASRDKTVKIWQRPDPSTSSALWAPVKTLKFDEGVTGCDFWAGRWKGEG